MTISISIEFSLLERSSVEVIEVVIIALLRFAVQLKMTVSLWLCDAINRIGRKWHIGDHYSREGHHVRRRVSILGCQ